MSEIVNGLALRGETWRNADGGKSGFVFFMGELVHVFFMCDRELLRIVSTSPK